MKKIDMFMKVEDVIFFEKLHIEAYTHRIVF